MEEGGGKNNYGNVTSEVNSQLVILGEGFRARFYHVMSYALLYKCFLVLFPFFFFFSRYDVANPVLFASAPGKATKTS